MSKWISSALMRSIFYLFFSHVSNIYTANTIEIYLSALVTGSYILTLHRYKYTYWWIKLYVYLLMNESRTLPSMKFLGLSDISPTKTFFNIFVFTIFSYCQTKNSLATGKIREYRSSDYCSQHVSYIRRTL